MILGINPTQQANTQNAPLKTSNPAFKGFLVKSQHFIDGVAEPNFSIYHLKETSGIIFEKLNGRIDESLPQFVKKLLKKYWKQGLYTGLKKDQNGISYELKTIVEAKNGSPAYKTYDSGTNKCDKFTSTSSLPAYNQEVVRDILYIPDEELGTVSQFNIVEKFNKYWKEIPWDRIS